MKFTENEYKIYKEYKEKKTYKTPEDEYEANKIKSKICIKCNKELSLNDFSGNTCGKQPFNKNGFRYKRPECKECSKKANEGKCEARKSKGKWNFIQTS